MCWSQTIQLTYCFFPSQHFKTYTGLTYFYDEMGSQRQNPCLMPEFFHCLVKWRPQSRVCFLRWSLWNRVLPYGMSAAEQTQQLHCSVSLYFQAQLRSVPATAQSIFLLALLLLPFVMDCQCVALCFMSAGLQSETSSSHQVHSHC